jgi:glycosyltransferase involved in cell wall biosynthesis
MCTYNGCSFLPEQLESIAAEKRAPDELVICDDKSTDNTAAIVEDFSERVPFPVRFFVNTANIGSTANFERAISLCSGDIVALADQDDVWYSKKLERIEQQFVASEAIVASFSDADLIRDDSLPMNSRLWTSVGFGADEQKKFSAGEATNVLIKRPVVTGAAMAFRRRFFDLLRPIPRDVVHDRWMSLLLSAIGPIAVIPEPLMQYRRHRGQQIGVGPQHFKDRFQQARTRGEDFHLSEVEFFRRVRNRLEQHRGEFPQVDIAVPEITKKISHLERRVQMRRTVLGRVPNVIREVCNRGYWRYSAGWESVAKDLFLPTTSS